jgi:membrane-associated phospholipid phosphatase
MQGFTAVFLAMGLALVAAEAWPQDSGDQKSANVVTTNSAPMPDISPEGKHVVQQDAGSSSRTDFSGHLTDFLKDQKQIWTSPFRARAQDATWLVPLAGITAGLFVTDRQYSASLPNNPATLHHYRTISDAGIAGLIGASAGMYLFSFPTHNEHWRETGFLAGEAALNSLLTTEALKYSLRRARPYQDNGSGSLFQGSGSFPSEHAAAAYSIAGVIAHEYDGPLPKLFAYGLASAVSYSKVHARDHFPSDVLAGSVMGYLIAQSVYNRHHDAEIGGAAFESPREIVSSDRMRTPSFMGSPYVPLDSWIYPALERLAALGYVKTAALGMRPWTRLECARLLGEASELLPDTDGPTEVEQLYTALSEEFSQDAELISGERNVGAQVESIYARTLGISGTPLTDNLHFGQTVLNDYGRPYEQGFNAVVGASTWATSGPFVIYARGEYQSSPSAASLPQSALDFMALQDGSPPNPPLVPVAAISRFQPLDVYVGMNLANWQLSYGRRSLWWGPGEGGAMSVTNNAAPLNNMFSVDRVSPFQLPWLFGYLGDIRLQFFIGRMSGQDFLAPEVAPGVNVPPMGQYGQPLRPQPFFSGGKVTLKMTENLELGLSKTTVWGGPGRPLTPTTFFESELSLHELNKNPPGVAETPLGWGESFADFTYRVPKLRDWLTFYGEAFSKDEVSPIAYMRKSVAQGGLYFAKLPKVPRLDLRLEGGYTSPVQGSFCTSCFYTDAAYPSGYTNDGRLMGDWIGRAAQGELIRTNYWLSPRKKIGLELRHRTIDRQYLPQGGNQNDAAVNADIFTKSRFRFTGNLQYERWQIPLLAANRQSNLTVSFQLGFWPTAHIH